MSNYLSTIKSLRNEICKRTEIFNKEIKPLNDALESLIKINTTCEYCEGTGNLYTYDNAGQKEQISCNNCGGSGYLQNEYNLERN